MAVSSPALHPSVPPARQRLRVLTLNTHKGFTVFNRAFVLKEMREAIRGISADVVLLQEVIGHHGSHARTHPGWPELPQYEFLADSIWSEFSYGRNAVYTEGHHGNAILSKFPIVNEVNHDISVFGPERRGLLHCVLRRPLQDDELHVICTHFSLTEAHRRIQLARLCDLINNEVPPAAALIVGGDFNDWRLRASHRLAHCGMQEVFEVLDGKSARTYPARLPFLRLDRIYYRNATPVASSRHASQPWSELSDHAALSAEFEL